MDVSVVSFINPSSLCTFLMRAYNYMPSYMRSYMRATHRAWQYAATSLLECCRGLVAQWITRLPTEQKIPGSNPGKLESNF